MANINGTPHHDFLLGTDGDDVLRGRGGADSLFAQDGNDNLYGGKGPDILEGGDGTDVFHFRPGSGVDFVIDLHVKSQDDSVVLYGVDPDDVETFFFENVNTTILVSDAGSVITFFGESETDVLSAISFQPADALIV